MHLATSPLFAALEPAKRVLVLASPLLVAVGPVAVDASGEAANALDALSVDSMR
jgi:hypothetical protein